MKALSLVLFLVVSYSANAQTPIERTIPLQGATQLYMELDYPEVTLETWDKSEILIKGTVSINQGENDAAFELTSKVEAGELKIVTSLKDKENIPHRITIRKGEKDYIFKAKDFDDPEIQKFLEENGRQYSYISSGIMTDIKLKIFVPRKLRTILESKYGGVEFKTFDAPLRVDAKYGVIDATIIAGSTGQLVARTKFGEILSNLDIKFNQSPLESRNEKWTVVTATPGKGNDYSLECKYGKLYLRKP